MGASARRWASIWILAALAAPASAGERWLHVRVRGSGGEAGSINVNVPLDAVQGLLPLVASGGLTGGLLHLDGLAGEVDVREVLSALRDTPDSVFVTVNDGDETIRVATERGRLVVHVDGGGEKVRLRIPLAVAEALVGTDPQAWDVAAALRALEAFEGEDLVVVESEEESVRVWVDSSEAGRSRPVPQARP